MRNRGNWLVGTALLAGLGVVAPHVATGADTPGKGETEAVSPFRAARESAPAPRASRMTSLSTVTLLQEGFTDTTFPPAGWSRYKLQGGGTAQWIRDTAQSYGAPASARRIYGGTEDGNQDDWLVTPALALSYSVLTYFDRGQWMPDYGYSGVWISTGSCNPADGAFVEVLETPDIPNLAWRALPVEVDLLAYNGQTACLAFRYSGDFAHTWWIDDVLVTSAPNVDVSPLALNASQTADISTQQVLSIGNTGGADLTWQIEQEPGASASPCASPADVPWLSVSPQNGTTAAGGSTPVTVGFDSTGLAPGVYTANLCVLCNDPDPGPGNGTGLVVVPVELNVTAPVTATVTVEVGPAGGGTVSGGGPYAIGDPATVTATPSPGWVFLYWQVGAVQVATNPHTFEVTEDVTLTAVFGLLGENIPTLGGVGVTLLILLVAGGALVALRRLV